MTPSLFTSLCELYSRHPRPIAPYVGQGWESPRLSNLRVMAIGINAYAQDHHLEAASSPAWYPSLFANGGKYRYPRALLKTVGELGTRLTAKDSGRWSGYSFDVTGSLMATNFVKSLLGERDGKQVSDLPAGLIEQHAETVRAELDLMAERGAFPHVIVVIGRIQWVEMWKALDVRAGSPLQRTPLRSYETLVMHYASHVRLDPECGTSDTLLLRVQHPASRHADGNVSWLFDEAGLGNMWKARATDP